MPGKKKTAPVEETPSVTITLPAMPVELTDAQFEIFKKEARRWIDNFGLNDWELRFSFEHNNDSDRARCYTNLVDRICTLELARWQSSERSEREIRTLAFHEVSELLRRSRAAKAAHLRTAKCCAAP